MSSTHRVPPVTQCNESKRKRISVPSLDQRPLKLLKSKHRSVKKAVKASALPHGFAFDERWLTAGPSNHAWLLTRPHPPLDAGFCGGGRENTDHVLAGSAPSPLLVGPADNTPRLVSDGPGSDAGGVFGVELRPGHNTGQGQQDACSSAVGASKLPTTSVMKLFLDYRFPSWLEALLVARWLAEHNQTLLIACSSKRTCGCRKDWRCEASSSFSPSKEFLEPRASGHCSSERAPLPFFLHASRPENGRRAEVAPLSAVANHSMYPPRRRKRMPRCQQDGKSFTGVRRYEKRARLSLVMAKIQPEVPHQGAALERDLERLCRKLKRVPSRVPH